MIFRHFEIIRITAHDEKTGKASSKVEISYHVAGDWQIEQFRSDLADYFSLRGEDIEIQLTIRDRGDFQVHRPADDDVHD